MDTQLAAQLVALFGVVAWIAVLIGTIEMMKREREKRQHFEKLYLEQNKELEELRSKLAKGAETGGYRNSNGETIDLYNLPDRGTVWFTRNEMDSDDFEWRYNYIVRFITRQAKRVPGARVDFFSDPSSMYWDGQILAWEIRKP